MAFKKFYAKGENKLMHLQKEKYQEKVSQLRGDGNMIVIAQTFLIIIFNNVTSAPQSKSFLSSTCFSPHST